MCTFAVELSCAAGDGLPLGTAGEQDVSFTLHHLCKYSQTHREKHAHTEMTLR